MRQAIILDTETTDIKEPEVIQLAYGGCQINTDGTLDSFIFNNSLSRFSKNYKPMGKISLGALSTHHILPSELEGCAPSHEATIPAVDFIVGHNIDFDWEALGKPRVNRICTLALAQKYYPELDSHTLVAMLYHLLGATERTREIAKNAHDAWGDVWMAAIVLGEMLKDRVKATSMAHLWELSEDARIPEIIRFGKHAGSRFAEIPRDYLQWILRQQDMDPYVREAAQIVVNG